MSISGTCRAGVDIGGTFTDVALEFRGAIHSAKVLTDHAAPERAIMGGLRVACEAAGVELAFIDTIIHGTTLATNSIIERRGARTAFITTKGFRDVLEVRTESRFEQYDLDLTLPTPLIDRADRFVLSERMSASGKVLVAPELSEVEALVDRIAAGNYESVAVGFLHSYVNGAHETLVREMLRSLLPSVSVSISSEVSPQMREFERFNTVCANAYVKPVIQSYLQRLVVALQDEGAKCPVFMIHSGGGIISVETAAEFPVRLLESGPAGGAIFAADLARRYGIDSAVSFDMGGTTAKVCLIKDQAPKTAKVFEVARTYRFKKGSGMPISIPVVEMVEIGAGGGSIVRVDSLNRIQVGPQSAGSEPGPACYQRGGSAPTVTDADLVLGRMDPKQFAGGKILLSPELAEEAIVNAIGDRLGRSAEIAAFGICEIVDENMANAGRVHAIESGLDIADFTMIAFGGAGPLHAARLCEKMGIGQFLVPPGAGVGSAIGFLRAPFGYEAVRSDIVRLSDFVAARTEALLAAMTEDASAFIRIGLPDGKAVTEYTAFMRYVGQGWEIPVTLPGSGIPTLRTELLVDMFSETYSRFFGYPIKGLDIEIVSWSVKIRSPPAPVDQVSWVAGSEPAIALGSRRLFDVAVGSFIDASVYHRHSLKRGSTIKGPAIIVEAETATLVTSSFEATLQADGCIYATRVKACHSI